tara:strand:+ start:8314 stop:8487 length:174 start_codon:yes stop_codon:yes gene_type:complete
MKLLERLTAPWDKPSSVWDVFMIGGIFTTEYLVVKVILLVILVVHTEIEYRIKELNK